MTNLAITKMSSKGQVVIPEEIRNRLGLEAGAQFVLVTDNDTLIMKAISPRLQWTSLITWLRKRGSRRKRQDWSKLISTPLSQLYATKNEGHYRYQCPHLWYLFRRSPSENPENLAWRWIACAIASDTRTIISGDNDLLTASGYESIQIVTPRIFVDGYIVQKTASG